MKTARLLLGIIVMLAFIGLNEAIGQWATVGTNIHNTNTGNVGIGSSGPTTLLHVKKVMTEPTITVQNLGGVGGATYAMVDNLSGANWKFKATATGGFKIRDHANLMDVFTIEANSSPNALYINSAGNIGIGTSTPARKLMIEGPDFELHDTYPFIFLNNTSATGNAGISIRYEGDYRAWIYYDDNQDVLRLNAENGNGWRNDLIIKSDGSVCMGTTVAATGYKLSVDGKVICTEVRVEALASWPDYVFGDDYDLMSLKELRQSVEENNHLPGLPSAAEVAENGILLGDMQTKLLEKIEELTLYTLHQDAQIEQLQQRLESLENSGLKRSRSRK
jgi:hypothetical protein